MARVFISYKRADKEIVFPLKDKIEAAIDEPCWIDLDGIESDAHFVNNIISAIDKAQVFLFMYSFHHTQIEDYKKDWTIREISYADEEGKRIVLVNLDNTPLSRWFRFMYPKIEVVDASSPDMINNLISDIRGWLNKSSTLLALDEERLEELKVAAEQGDPKAQNQMGINYEKGLGIQKDKTEAVKWFLKAAEQGHAGAQHNLGYCYSHGQGVPLDHEQAYQWYLKSALQGYVRAQCNVGNCFYKSRGVPQDYAQAFYWYNKAAQKGYARAEYKLGLCYYFGQGVAENQSEAMSLMEKSAGQGYQDAVKFLNDH